MISDIVRRSGRSTLEWLYRSGLLNLFPAVFARPTRVIIPEVDHGLAEMLYDISAIEVNVFHQRTAIVAIKNNMLLFSGRAPALDHYTKRVWRPLRGMRDIRWNKERFTLPNDMIDDPLAFTNAHPDVSLKLVEVLFRIDQMKIVSRIWAGDHHDEKVAAVVKIAVADRWLEKVAVLFNPVI
ncbi:MAG: hypothetical protein QOH24_91 [Verrucomicrobiota bacterium]